MAQAQFLVSVMTLLCHGLGSFSSCCAEHISKVALRPHWRGESSGLTPLLGDPGRPLLGSWSSITLPTSPAFGAAVDREGAGRFQPCWDRASSPFLIPAGSDPSSASTTQRGGLYPPWCTWGLPSMEERVWPPAPPHSLPRCPALASAGVGPGETPCPCLVFIYLLPEAVNSSAFLPSTFFSFLLYLGDRKSVV